MRLRCTRSTNSTVIGLAGVVLLLPVSFVPELSDHCRTDAPHACPQGLLTTGSPVLYLRMNAAQLEVVTLPRQRMSPARGAWAGCPVITQCVRSVRGSIYQHQEAGRQENTVRSPIERQLGRVGRCRHDRQIRQKDQPGAAGKWMPRGVKSYGEWLSCFGEADALHSSESKAW